MWRSAVQVCLGLHIGAKPCVTDLHFLILSLSLGGLAQLARAPALQAGGQRFESVILHYAVHSSEVSPQNTEGTAQDL